MKNILLLAGIIILTACKSKTKEQNYNVAAHADKLTAQVSQTEPEGKILMENKCYVCHSPSGDHDQRIGPPMAAIKARYLKDHEDKAAFGDAIWHFVEKPTAEKGKMRGAIRRFGAMPYQAFPEEEIKAIASFMYDYKIEEPVWFKEHWEERHGPYGQPGKELKPNTKTEKTVEEMGMSYAMGTKKELGKNLMGTIQKKGTLAALEFCNVRAYPLTDSMATVHNAKIKRVSDRPRNPNNSANTTEMQHIASFKDLVNTGQPYEPILEENGNEVTFYYPIVTNTNCLQCHGSPQTDIKQDVITKIKSLYPKDLATGYTANEVRGMWSIHFTKE